MPNLLFVMKGKVNIMKGTEVKSTHPGLPSHSVILAYLTILAF
jgi:hypothetical protein